jgi:NAD(P)-dependent dehydrogenase (short-subunit alcohol dehydrogenase family)
MPNELSAFRLDDKLAMVVGAASGIGRATARALAQQGARVVCADVNLAGAEATASEIGPAASAISLDIRSKLSVDQAIEGIKNLDVLVVTPAINVRKKLLAYSEEELDRVVDLNLKGCFRITQAAGQVMNNGGSIILTSSIRSVTVEPGQGIYAATKAALVQLARGFAVELAGRNIRVNAIAPGVIDTPLTAPIKNHKEWYSAYASKSALKRWGTPEEIAWPIVFLASPSSSFITGTVLFVDGGWTGIDGRFEPQL